MACRDRSSEAFRTGDVRNWARNRAIKTDRLVGPIAKLKGLYFQPSLSVCVSVCLSQTGTSTLQRGPILIKLGHKDPALAATLMVRIGRRGTARRLFENFKKILKNRRIRI